MELEPLFRVTTAEGTQAQMLRSGSSYLSASELVLTFGVGQQTKVNSVEIRWPSGQVDKLSNVNAGQTVTGYGRKRRYWVTCCLREID